jgi:hypothetical protein
MPEPNTGDRNSHGSRVDGRELRQPLHQKLKIGLDRGKIDALGVASPQARMVIGAIFGRPSRSR